MNNEIEKLEVKKILDNLEYVSDIHKVFIEDGYKIQEEIPSSQVKELRLNSYSAKLLSNYINNLQSKIDKAIEFVESMEYCGQEDYFYDKNSKDPCGNDNTFNDSKNKLLSILKEDK